MDYRKSLNVVDDWKRILRATLPYGLWTMEGAEVLFDRDYKPRWIRKSGEKAVVVDSPGWRVPYIDQRWFFDDSDCLWAINQEMPAARQNQCLAARSRCEAALEAFLRGRDVDAYLCDDQRSTT